MRQNSIQLGKIKVGPGYRPFVIAEMSGNHNQSLERALKIVDEAFKAGCHALKIQTYTADTMTLDMHGGDFVIQDQNSLWHGRTLYDLYQQAHTPWAWHEEIFSYAQKLGLIAFSSPFDETAVDFLESLNVPLYKIASFENTHLPLLRRVARTKKPIIMSTGIATLAELSEAVQTIRSEGNDNLILLKCTSTYPASPEDSNIATIPHMSELFNTVVGLSDHTLGIGAAVAAVTLGASVIEKHFTLSRQDGGVDAAFSLEPHEMKSLVDESLRAFQAIGKTSYIPSEKEMKSAVFRRSIFVVEDLEVGMELTTHNLRIVRPNSGLAPKHFDSVIGRRVKCKIARGTPLNWNLIE